MAITNSNGSVDGFSASPAAGVVRPTGQATDSWDAFNQQLAQYFGPLSPSNSVQGFGGDPRNSPIVNVPGLGQLQRTYNTGPTLDQFTTQVSGGEDAGSSRVDQPGYQAALDAYNKLSEAQKYSYGNLGTHTNGQLKGHNQTYAYDPATGGVKIDGSDFDNTPNLFEDKIFPALVQTFIGGVAGAGLVGALGAAGGAEAGAAGATGSGLADAGLAAGEYGLDAGLGGQAAFGGAAQGAAGGGFGAGFDGQGIGFGNGFGVDAPAGAAALENGAYYDAAGNFLGTTAQGAAEQVGQGVTVAGSAGSGAGASFGSVLPYVGGAAAAGTLLPKIINPQTGSVTGRLSNQTPGSTTPSNPFRALSNLYNNGLTNGSAEDYYSLASLLGQGASAFLGSNAATQAAKTQADAANQANTLATSIFNQNTANNAPYINAGAGALGQQTSLLGLNGKPAQQTAFGNFQTSPDYQFRYDQGLKAANNGAAASGLLGSGRYLKDLTNYGQGAASQEYGNYFNRLGGISSLGQASAANQAAQGNAFSNAYGNNLTSGAAATAAGQVGSTNAITSAIGGAINQGNSNGILQAILNSQRANGIYPTGTGY